MPPDLPDATAPSSPGGAGDPTDPADPESHAPPGELPRAQRDGLLARLSHELRTPISLVVGPLEDALEDADEPLAPAHEERLRVAYRNGLRLVRIMDAMLDGAAEDVAAPAPRAPDETSRSRREDDARALERSTRGRILVVDDNADMRAYVAQLLSRHYDVEDAADGASALEAALRCPPDLILSDIAMPGLDGLSLVRALRAHEATRATCVVLVSAERGEDVPAHGFEIGADDYVVKPFSPRELRARVAAHVATARVRREAARREAAAREDAERASRRAAEAEMRLVAASEAERRLFLLSEALRGSTWEVDVATRRVRWGESVAALAGFASRDLSDPFGTWIERIHPDDRERVTGSFEAALASAASSWSAEYRLRRRDGTVAVVSARAVIDRDVAGRAVRAIGVALDVTEQRAVDERLCAVEPTARETILVVEDEALVRNLTRRILEHAGFRVIEAANGGEALELASEAHESLRLVVSDLVMPRVGGRELSRLLRARGLEVPMLFMSAYSGDHIARYELLDPQSPFLQKPFAVESLLREVRAVLGRAGSR